jgi:hypothetical protein
MENARLEDSVITNNSSGSRFYMCTVVAGDNSSLSRNRFIGNSTPAVCVLDRSLSKWGRIRIEHNEFSDNYGAIYVSTPTDYYGSVDVVSNDFYNNYPIYRSSSAVITFFCSNATLLNNNIHTNQATYDVQSSCDLPATNNWWGTTDAATIASRILGDNVEYTPFAKTPIPDAGVP